MESPPIGGEDLDGSALDLSRHRRAIILIAFSVGVIIATELVYAHPLSISILRSTHPAAAPPPISMSMPGDTGRAPRLPLTEVFQSPTMHYAINFPAGWTATPASQAWRGRSDPVDEQNADKLVGGSVVFTGTSELLAGGQSPANWIGWYLAAAGTDKCGVREYTDFMGLTGVIDLNGCASTNMAGHLYSAAVVIDGRGYSFTIEGRVDHSLFVSMLRTVSFGP
jgi:hypothetical protein